MVFLGHIPMLYALQTHPTAICFALAKPRAMATKQITMKWTKSIPLVASEVVVSVAVALELSPGTGMELDKI